jgi:hypothetical protein
MSLLAYKHYLAHHGIKGQKWGIRRYQNEDGSLTPEGKERYLKNNQAKWSKQFDDEETTFKIANKDYKMTIENSNNDKNTQRIKNVMAEIWNEGTISQAKKDIADGISEEYKPQEFGYKNDIPKDVWKKIIESKLDIEGLTVVDEIQKPSANSLPWEKEDGEWVPAGVWFTFDGVPFYTNIEGSMSLTKKKLTNVGSFYPD